VSRPELPASPRFTLQVNAVTQQTSAPQKLYVAAVYFSSEKDPITDSARFLDTATVAITGGPQQVTLRIDLSACLADQTRRGSRTPCSMSTGAFLEPQTFSIAGADPFGSAFDYQLLGPFDAAPGRTPSVPAIDLATSRFAVNHWEVDEALRLG